MKIVVFETHDAVLPAHRCLARIWCEFTTKGGKGKMDWSPIVFHGADPEELRERAQAWWDAQVELERRKSANVEKRVAARAEKMLAASQEHQS